MSIPSARGPSWQLTKKHWKYVTHNKRNILFIFLVWLKLNDDTIMLMGHNRMTNNLWWNTFWPTSFKNRNEYNKNLSIFRTYYLCQCVPSISVNLEKKYGVLDFSKKRTKFTNLSTKGAQDSEFCLFFGRIQDEIVCCRDLLTFKPVQ